jgi:hypothetical protein
MSVWDPQRPLPPDGALGQSVQTVAMRKSVRARSFHADNATYAPTSCFVLRETTMTKLNPCTSSRSTLQQRA